MSCFFGGTLNVDVFFCSVMSFVGDEYRKEREVAVGIGKEGEEEEGEGVRGDESGEED